MKKLLREQMKNVMGGEEVLTIENSYGCAEKDHSCYFSNGKPEKTCCSGLTCKDQGSEIGSLCK